MGTIVAVPLATLSLSASAPSLNTRVPIPLSELGLESSVPSLNTGVGVPAASIGILSYAPTPVQRIIVTGVDGIDSGGGVGDSGMALTDWTGVRVYIDGVDRTEWVKESSISLSDQVGGRAVCRFVVVNKTSTLFTPAIDSEVIVMVGSRRAFGGYIETTDGSSSYGKLPVAYGVTCGDYGSVCDKRVASFLFTQFYGFSVMVMMPNICSMFLQGTGITFVQPALDSPIRSKVLGIIAFNHIPVSEALNQVCASINCDWRIDAWKNLIIFEKDAGIGAAPFTVTDANRNSSEVRVSESQGAYRNRQGVKNSRAMTAVWSDEFPRDFYRFGWTFSTGDTLSVWPTTYGLGYKPIVKVAGVTQSVAHFNQIGKVEADFYWGGVGVSKRQGTAALPWDTDVKIYYPSPLSPIYWAQDDAEILAHGLVEAVEEAQDLDDIESVQALAENLLERGKFKPKEVEVRTILGGVEPGHLLPVNVTYPPVNDTFLVESVDAQEFGMGNFWYTIRASNSQLQRSGSGLNLYQRIFHRLRQPIDRVAFVIEFGLAITVPGYTNPGLAVGYYPQCMKVAEKDGVLRDVTMRWSSVDTGTPTDLPIEIDILQNGFSIFPVGERLVFAAGEIGTVTQWLFESEDMARVVRRGDIFTLEVISADPKAMDGKVKLTVLG